MAGQRFPTLTREAMTAEQRRATDGIEAGPRGAGLRGPFNALLRSPELCELVQRVGAYVRFGSAIPAMQAGGGGAIVNVASIVGLRNEPNGRELVAYSAAKAALIQFTRSTAGAFARHGIRCNTVVPGLMHTPLVEHRLVRQGGGNDAAALVAKRNARPPLGHMGSGWDVAHAVLFLASDEAGYITGTELVVDGGLTTMVP